MAEIFTGANLIALLAFLYVVFWRKYERRIEERVGRIPARINARALLGFACVILYFRFLF